MDRMQKMLSDAAKAAELELQLPALIDRHKELQETVSDLKTEMDWARLTAKNLEDPGFFQRLLGKVVEKQEKAQAEAREAIAAYEQARREFEEQEHQVQDLQEEYAALSSCREAYDQARAEFLCSADSDAVQQLRELECDTFRPVAVEALRQIRRALNASRGWMEKELKSRHYIQESRRMEFIQIADAYAQMLHTLLPYFPEGSITLGASITAPGDYIRGASMNLSQMDRLNIAIDQSLRVQEQLEAL